MIGYRLIFTLVSALLVLCLAGCGTKIRNGGSSPTGGDAAKNDLVSSKTCSGNTPAGRTIINKWSFKQNVKGGSYQMDINILNARTDISVTCIQKDNKGTQTKILSDSVPTQIINNQFVISDNRNQTELVGRTPCNLSLAAQTWTYNVTGDCLILTSGKMTRTWVHTN